jgi:hypothetical protein
MDYKSAKANSRLMQVIVDAVVAERLHTEEHFVTDMRLAVPLIADYRETDIMRAAEVAHRDEARAEHAAAKAALTHKIQQADKLRDELAEQMRKIAEEPAPAVGRPRVRRSGTMTSLTDSLPSSEDEQEAAATLNEFQEARNSLRRTVSMSRGWDVGDDEVGGM